MDTLVILAAKYLLVVIVATAVSVVFFDKERRNKLFFAALLALPVGYLLARFIGLFFSHVQPFAAEGFEPLVPHDVDNSFPSDHTLMGGIFSMLAFFSSRRVGLGLWLLTLALGLSRMLAGLHWGVDVAASAILAAAVSFAAYRVVEHFSSGFSPAE